MLVKAGVVEQDYGQACSAHVVVVGNEKGGSGKSTTSMHIAVALVKAGQRVATIDLDCRQGSFTPLHRKSPRLGEARQSQSRTAETFPRLGR